MRNSIPANDLVIQIARLESRPTYMWHMMERSARARNTPLIGDKSGDREGQGRVVTVLRQSCDTLAM
ncbi:hypothetical protein TNCV_5105651 [Trichonephila clavipes]|nr:hypothetical protein TNCV_5105651 [Trichonephila clavipes]